MRASTWSGRLATFALGLWLGLGACAKPYDPFRVPEAELRSRIRTIALAPLQGRAAVVDRAHARSQLEPLVTARLGAGGFQVVASEEMERLWREAAEDVGGVFDPVTGDVDRERFDAVESSVYHELRARHAVDAVLWLGIETIDIYLTRGSVNVCGVTDAMYWPPDAEQPLESATLVRAICLATILYDMEERELYNIRAGLETIETFAAQTHAARPLEQRLQSPGRLRHAVDLTIGPLAGDAAGR